MPIPIPRANLPRMILVAIALQSTFALSTNLSKLRPAPEGAPVRVEDTDIYERYSSAMVRGQIPYRDFRVEYPPLAIPVFLVPRVLSRSLEGYKVGFAVEMLFFNALTVWVVATWVDGTQGRVQVRRALGWYTLYFCMLSKFAVSRFDAVPMFLGFAAAVAWASGKGRLGGLATALGTLLKIYPALLVLLFFGRSSRDGSETSGRQGTIVFGVIVLVGVVAWLALGGLEGVTASIGYHAGRGFEYGSLYASTQMLVAKIVGAEIVVGRDRASYSSVTVWTPAILPLAFPIQALTVVLVALVARRNTHADPIRYSGALILGFIVTGKVFSPQYLLWVLPFLASGSRSTGRHGRWIFAAVCLATLLAPSGTPYYPRTSLWIILPYNLKNALSLWLFFQQVLGRDDETD